MDRIRLIEEITKISNSLDKSVSDASVRAIEEYPDLGVILNKDEDPIDETYIQRAKITMEKAYERKRTCKEIIDLINKNWHEIVSG